MEKGNFDIPTLEGMLRVTLKRQSDLTPRFVRFLETLLSAHRVFGREEVKQRLLQKGVGSDISQTGRYLSNLSQFLTKKSNPHLRQIISFTSAGPAVETKDNYQIVPEYRELVQRLVDQWNVSESPVIELPEPQIAEERG